MLPLESIIAANLILGSKFMISSTIFSKSILFTANNKKGKFTKYNLMKLLYQNKNNLVYKINNLGL